MNWEVKLKQVGRGQEQPRWSVQMPPLISARDLQRTEFQPISWLVRDMIPEGLTILAGKPKQGKSWRALDIGYAVANGGEVLGRQVEEGSVLYAALEDNRRRLKARLQKMTPNAATWPETLNLAVEWNRLDAGGLAAIEAWVDAYPDARLVIIDTLATVRPQADSRNNPYQNDYAAMRGLHAIANSRGIAILVVHHVRKADADDPFDTVSGSTGLTGAADATLILTSTTDGKVLYGAVVICRSSRRPWISIPSIADGQTWVDPRTRMAAKPARPFAWRSRQATRLPPRSPRHQGSTTNFAPRRCSAWLKAARFRKVGAADTD